MVNKTRIKVCCISSLAEASMAIQAGVNAVGLVSAMPSGPGVISEDLISEISRTIPPGVASFLLTSKHKAEDIIEQQKRCRTNTIQICDYLQNEEHLKLLEALPGISIVQVVHVTGEESIEFACKISGNVHALLLDSGNPKLIVKELGGTGRIHNWEISKRICESVKVPVFLAGGLTPENVRSAIEIVHPFGVDVCSGVRTEGRLDKNKLTRFIEEIGLVL